MSWAMSSPRRRRIEITLGLVWLLDGALQFQPYMFTKGFFEGILGMANMGLPGPLGAADYHISLMLVAHPVFWNAVFASLQVAIGLGFLWGRGRVVALARPVSIVWALGVWVIGEGVGGMFMGGTSLLTGAPGAAVLYIFVAVAVWPVRPDSRWARVPGRVAAGGWALALAGSALLELHAINGAAGVPAAQISNGAFGEPGWVASIDRTAGHALVGGGGLVALALGVVATAAALGVWWQPTRRAAVLAGLGLALFVGLVGQDLGGIFTGQGTDPGSGPLLVLLALSLWPARPAVLPVPAPVRQWARPDTRRTARAVGPAATVPG